MQGPKATYRRCPWLKPSIWHYLFALFFGITLNLALSVATCRQTTLFIFCRLFGWNSFSRVIQVCSLPVFQWRGCRSCLGLVSLKSRRFKIPSRRKNILLVKIFLEYVPEQNKTKQQPFRFGDRSRSEYTSTKPSIYSKVQALVKIFLSLFVHLDNPFSFSLPVGPTINHAIQNDIVHLIS